MFWTIAIIYIVDGIIFGLITRYVSESKGYDGGFAWGFWLGLIGLLVVGFRPSIEPSTPQKQPMYGGALQSFSTQPKMPMWECGCGAKNPGRLDYCLSCRSPRGTNKPIPKIACPQCGAANKETNTHCWTCNHLLSDGRLHAQEGKNISNTAAETITNGKADNDSVVLIQKLADLHERGVLTDEEFSQKKADILAKL